MSQNSVPPSPTQGLTNQATIDFLEGLGLPLDQLWLAWSITHANGQPGWRTARYSRAVVAAMPANQRHHVSSGLYPPGVAKRDDHKDLLGVWCICFDDVGDLMVIDPVTGKTISHLDIALFELGLLPPETWSMETSAGNHQFVFQFDPVLTSAEAVAVINLLKLRYGSDVIHSRGQYLRTPTGINSKRGNVLFPTKFRSKDGPKYTYASFLAAIGSSPGEAEDLVSHRPKKAKASSQTCSEATMKALLDALDPNDGLVFKDHINWIGVAHAIKNTLGEAGEDLWLDWSNRYTGHTKSSGEALRVWETLGDNHTNDLNSLRKYLIETHGEPAAIVGKIKQMIADDQAPLTAIDPADIPASPAVSPDTRKEEAAKKRLDELLKEARRLTPIPDQHRGEEDKNWLGKDGALVDALDRLGKIPSAAPTVIQPHVKGVVTMIAGPPSKSKSTLALNQALAIAYADQSLIRWGQDRLQFPGDVVYVSNEDPLNTVDRRITAFDKVNGLTGRPRQHGFFPVTSKLLSRSAKGEVAIECLRIVEAMVARVRAGGRIALVVIDTMPSSILGFEENSSQEMAEVLALLHRIARAFWCSVVFVHHGTKAGWDNGDARTLAAAARGTGGLTGSVRGLVVMSDPTEDDRSRFKLPLTGHRFVVEFLLKNSDGRQGEVVGIYEIISVDIDVLDAETGLLITDSAPVLVPWKAAHSFTVVSTPADEQVWLDKLEKATSPMRRYKAKAQKRHVDDDSVHHVLDVTVAAAYDIIEILKGKGLVRVDKNTNDHTEWVVVERIF